MADNETRQGSPSVGEILWEYADFIPGEKSENPAVRLPGSTLSSPRPGSVPEIPELQDNPWPEQPLKADAAEPAAAPAAEPPEQPEQAAPAAEPEAPGASAEAGQQNTEPPQAAETAQGAEETEAPQEGEPAEQPEPDQEPDGEPEAPPRYDYEPEPERTEPFWSRFSIPNFRRGRMAPVVPPDATPQELAEEYSEGLGALRIFSVCSAIVSFLLLFFSFAASGIITPLAELFPFGANPLLHIGLLILSTLLAMDVLDDGFHRLIELQPNASSVALLALVFTLLDAATLQMGSLRDFSLPFCLPCSLVLTAQVVGRYLERSTFYENAETAASRPRLYLASQERGLVGGQPAFCKRLGVPKGFGSQVRTENTAQASYSRSVPVLLAMCVVLSLVTTAAHHQPRLLLWALSGSLIAAAGMVSALGFSLPFSLVSHRLRKVGAVLAGWPGILSAKGCRNVLLTDFDLYPPGTVTLARLQLTSTFSSDQVISYTASVLRAAGSGLSYAFVEPLHREKGTYFPVNSISFPGNGVSGETQGRSILLGGSDFISKMGITIPSRLVARDAVFCAINSELAAVFYMHYKLHPSVLPAMQALFLHRVRPVFATRDFNIHPRKMRSRGAIPSEKITFPDLQRRIALSAPSAHHSSTLLAVITVEGMAAIAGVIAGAKRTERIVRLNSVLTQISCVIGILLVEILVSAAALTALSALHLAGYLLLWMVPTILFSYWVPRY